MRLFLKLGKKNQTKKFYKFFGKLLPIPVIFIPEALIGVYLKFAL